MLKVEEHSHTAAVGTPEIPIEQQVTITSPRVELDTPLSDDLFSFIPPAGSHRLEDFPDPRTDYTNSSLTGTQIPPLKLKSADGKVVSLESLRGKPVLLDLWATWCAPCIASLPHIATIYREAKDKGLVLLSVDQDEETKTASDYLAKKGYDWHNFHDGDGEIEKLLGNPGVPRMILVNADGKVVQDAMAPSEDQLRAEIAKLSPEFASLAPKPQSTPCTAIKAEISQK